LSALKALVTGATGFIGSHLVNQLIEQNYSIRCLIRRTSDTTWLRDLPIEYAYGDLFDHNALQKAVTGVDVVYHCAGITKARATEEYYRGNATGTKNILQAIITHQRGLKRFVHISSQAAVGPSPSREPINETATPHPITSYGKSKWMAEQACLSVMARLPITICRPPVVYGPRDKDVFEFFRTMNRGLQPLVGFKEKLVSMIHVSDLVRGCIMAGESERAVGETYFISSTRTFNWMEIGEVTKKIMNRTVLRVKIPEFGVYAIAALAEVLSMFSRKPALINFEKAKDMVQDYWTCDSSKAKNDFGFVQRISLEDGIKDTVEWYRKHGWMKAMSQ
jgi:dihydroflavonol-4-reductase